MANAKKIDKYCEDCGVLLVNVAPTRKYCYACVKERQREYQRHYKKEKREKGEQIAKKPQAPNLNQNKKYCKDCAYWGGAYINNACCNYIFVEGHSRPCPPGKGCTERVRGKKFRVDLAGLG